MEFEKLFNSIGLNIKAHDATFLLIMLVLISGFAFFIGRARLDAMILGLFASYTLVSLAHFAYFADPAIKTLIFLAVIVIFALMFDRLFRPDYYGSKVKKIVISFVSSLILISTTIAISSTWLPKDILTSFVSKELLYFFSSEISRFAWAMTSFLYIIIFRR